MAISDVFNSENIMELIHFVDMPVRQKGKYRCFGMLYSGRYAVGTG